MSGFKTLSTLTIALYLLLSFFSWHQSRLPDSPPVRGQNELAVTKPIQKGEDDRAATTFPSPSPRNKLSDHNSPEDCWISYRGNLYNITTYFGTHPGGDAVLSRYCGKDATTAFETKDKNPAVAHSAGSAALLQQYLIQ